jgi:eukaryotic-like serine/threonine-protein kinase
MKVTLSVTQGPHQGKEFVFEGYDKFLVGRSKEADFKLPQDDPFFSRRHFLIEINPPRCCLLDLGSRNGTYVNGQKIQQVELKDGDQIKAGHTVLAIHVENSTPVVEENQNPTNDEAKKPPHTVPQPLPVPKPPEFVKANVVQQDLPIIPGYRLEKELGRGGMGVVYRGIRESDSRLVALKLIHSARAASEKHRQKFLRESDVLRQLVHTNIVPFLDSGIVDGIPYLVMHYVSGTDVEKILLAKGPLKPRLAVRLICQALQGLAFAHQRGFVHRDIKPSNLLLEFEGEVKAVRVADFGLARAYQVSQLSGLTVQGEFSGTMEFMPPEQVTHFREVQPTCDQFAAAATLYYLLTGKFIREVASNMTIAQKLRIIISQNAIPIRDRNPSIPEELAEIVHKGLSLDRKGRYPDVNAFKESLIPFTK